jgi:hypothetical protein
MMSTGASFIPVSIAVVGPHPVSASSTSAKGMPYLVFIA